MNKVTLQRDNIKIVFRLYWEINNLFLVSNNSYNRKEIPSTSYEKNTYDNNNNDNNNDNYNSNNNNNNDFDDNNNSNNNCDDNNNYYYYHYY